MTNPVKIRAVYMDYPHYIKPKQVMKVFKLLKKHDKSKSAKEKAEIAEDIHLLLKVITAGGKYTYYLTKWINKDHKSIAVLEVLEPLTRSLFEKGQDDDWYNLCG